MDDHGVRELTQEEIDAWEEIVRNAPGMRRRRLLRAWHWVLADANGWYLTGAAGFAWALYWIFEPAVGEAGDWALLILALALTAPVVARGITEHPGRRR